MFVLEKIGHHRGNTAASLRETSPTLPLPTLSPSTFTTGNNPLIVPVTKHSLHRASSLRLTRFSTTLIPNLSHSRTTKSRVTPHKIFACSGGVTTTSPKTKNTFVCE